MLGAIAGDINIIGSRTALASVVKLNFTQVRIQYTRTIR